MGCQGRAEGAPQAVSTLDSPFFSRERLRSSSTAFSVREGVIGTGKVGTCLVPAPPA